MCDGWREVYWMSRLGDESQYSAKPSLPVDSKNRFHIPITCKRYLQAPHKSFIHSDRKVPALLVCVYLCACVCFAHFLTFVVYFSPNVLASGATQQS